MSSTPSNNTALQNVTVNSSKIKDIYDLLLKGDEQIKFSPNKDIVLLVGNTGSGKSTFAQYISGNSENLISKEVVEGLGEYIIIDKKNKISTTSTVLSHTTFPELITDTKTNITYYDSPGFSDSRTAAHEIAATYFIKKVIDSARSVKLVFVVSYHSVRQGVDRKDFILMLKHTSDFMKNTEKLKNSVALVVTKVENTYVGKQRNLVSDKIIVKGVIQYLEQVKKDVNDQPVIVTSNGQNPDSDKKVQDLLDAILYKENEVYKRIGIFRRPDEPGPLSNIELLKEGKISLENLITKNIQYTQVNKEDFGYTISSDSKLLINELVQEIYKVIVKKIVSLGNEIEEYYAAKEKKSGMGQLEELFKKAYESFSEIQNVAFRDSITPQDFIRKIGEKINHLKITISHNHLKDIKKNEGYIKFLSLVSNYSPTKDGSSLLAVGLTKVIKYFNHSRRFYASVAGLYAKLSKYDVQNIRSKYITKEVMRFGDLYGSPLKDFIRDIFRDVESSAVNKPQLNLLNRVLDLKLNYHVESTCRTPNELVVKGQYIKLSDVRKMECNGDIKFIEILALETVFIDTSLDLTGKEVEIAIVANVWEVIGSQRIILDGAPGAEHGFHKAKSGWGYGSSGSDGLPGEPGGPAGNFLGIGRHFIKDEFLQVSANGGTGGDGMSGGDGADGADGPECSSCEANGDGLIAVFYNSIDVELPGQPGGHGGNGGVGGYGGLGGRINFIVVGKDPVPVKAKVSSTHGAAGKGGEGGRGGSGGRYFVNKVRTYVFVLTDNVEPKDQWAPSGRYGRDATNRYGIQNTWKLSTLLSSSKVKDHYVYYLSGSLSNSLNEKALRNYLGDIKNNDDITRNRKKRNVAHPEYYEESTDNREKLSIYDYRTPQSFDQRRQNSYVGRTIKEYSDNQKHNNIKETVFDNHAENLNNPLGAKQQRSFNQNIKKFPDNIFVQEGRYERDGNLLNEELFPAQPSKANVNDTKASSLKSAYRNDNKMFQNVNTEYPITNADGNLLLWDLVLKKLTRRKSPAATRHRDSHQDELDYASNLAYRYYSPSRI